MEEKERKDLSSKRDILDDSHISINLDINLKKYEEDKREQNPKLEIIEEETKNYMEDMKKGTYNIMVAVRCRPLWNKEKEVSDYEIVKILDRKMVILMDPYEYNAPSEVFKNRSREQNYAFDFAFDKTCNQHTVFTYTTKFLLDGVVNGYNATVFAYGATGAGKTYTMLGNEEDPGIMPLTLQELFNKVEDHSTEREYKVKLWYIEIYNENIRDLLSSSDEYLDLREDPNKGISIANISELNVTSCKDIMQILKRGNKNRTQEATNANETSSRSHAILQVQVEYKDKATGLEAEIRIGKLSLIDLAGSERASATQNRGIRLIEGANINRSLLTLGNCINALCEASEKGTKPYVPYRDSKLTRLLKDSLGGNSRTVMIANVSPSVTTFDDTYNTLKYANRAKNIKTHVQRNVLSVQYHISNYNNIISNLKNEILDLKQQLAKATNTNIPTNKHSSDTNVVNVFRKEEIKERDRERDHTKDRENSRKVSSTNANVNSFNYSLFEKCVQELKSHCEDESSIKHKIIDQEQEINNLKAIIKNYQNANKENKENKEENNSNINTIEKSDELLRTEANNSSNMKEDVTAIDEKDIIIINNNNGIPLNGNNSDANSSRAKSSNSLIRDKEIKLSNLKKLFDLNMIKLKDLQSKRELMMNNFYKMGIRDFHFEYMQSILKAHSLKLAIIENKFKEKFNVALAGVKENYIVELENQVRLRDEIIRRQGLNLEEEEVSTRGKIKSIEQLKNEYSNKLPIIPMNTRDLKDLSSNNHSINYNYNNNLPPIIGKDNSNNNIERLQNQTNSNIYNTPQHNSHITNNINSILSDLKIVNNNLNRLEMNQIHNQLLKRDKSKLRSEFINGHANNKEIAKEKMNQARNYSQGIRNINVYGERIGNNLSNVNASNIPNYNNSNIPINPSSNGNNIYTLNQRVQLSKNPSSKQMKSGTTNLPGSTKNISNNNNNMNPSEKKFIKDSHSEKSINYSNNISNENEINEENSDEIDIINNHSDNEANIGNIANYINIPNLIPNIANKDIRKRNNHFKDQRKSALNKEQGGSKEESPSYYASPLKKDFMSINANLNANNYYSNKNKRDDSVNKMLNGFNNNNDYLPQFKKRDLNVYQLGRVKNQKKMPFKI